MENDSSSVSDLGGDQSPTTPTSIDPDSITTTSLAALQSEKQRRLMDIVDRLRRRGLSSVVELPQLVVCGDQSSGKSSVLEAITEIPFPRKENLCTRFATEIILRRTPSSKSTVTITPDKHRPKSEQAKLKSFNRSIKAFDQLPDVIEEATQAMGLGVVGGINSKAFSRDVLSVEITGPTRPQFTLVDLPGLIHATNKAQTEIDKELILNLVKEYMKNPRTIILAVVSAKNDFANQVILDHCRKVDEQGRRTLGIITKPDFLREGSENELAWIELAQNKDIYLERGWHMLKNREDHQTDFSFEQRRESEKLFFQKGRYADLARECVGIDALCMRLSKLLYSHLIKELPALKEQMETELQGAISDIEKLGDRRDTLPEQRMLLMRLSVCIDDTLRSATKGDYEAPFFGPVDMYAAVDEDDNIRRFRAVVQYLNLEFANDMRLRGHKFFVAAADGSDEEKVETKEEVEAQKEVESVRDCPRPGSHPYPIRYTNEEAINWVKKTMERSRGHELPGTFQPMLISQLFWELSQPWENIAAKHMQRIAYVSKIFVDKVLDYHTPPELKEQICALSVNSALARALNGAKEELQKVLKDKARNPATYNHYFTTTIQKTRLQKFRQIVELASEVSSIRIRRAEDGVATYIDPVKLAVALDKAVELDMDVFSCKEALDIARAYYKDEMKYFVGVVTKAVIERHLVEPLPDIIFSPLVVTGMPDTMVQSIAAEPDEVSQQRAHLESRKVMLEDGLRSFQEAMTGFRR